MSELREQLAKDIYETNPASSNLDNNGKLLGYFRELSWEAMKGTGRTELGCSCCSDLDIYEMADALIAKGWKNYSGDTPENQRT